MFYIYTCNIYRELGRSLSQRQKSYLQYQCKKFVKTYTFRKFVKEWFKEHKEKKAQKKQLKGAK